MKHYTISFYWLRKRRAFVRPTTYARALLIGRHLWKLRYFGVSFVQIEEGCFPTTHIPTEGKPVTREADSMTFPIKFEGAQNRSGEVKIMAGLHDMKAMSEAKLTPRVWRQQQLGGDGPNGGIVFEGERTNLALWSEGKHT